jgi:hypothetical protein
MLILGGIIFIRTFHENTIYHRWHSSCCGLLDCSCSLSLEVQNMSFLLVWTKKDHHVRTSSQDLLPDKDSPLTIIKFAFQTNLRFQSNNAQIHPHLMNRNDYHFTGYLAHIQHLQLLKSFGIQANYG